jgi:hypothetical protein
VGGPAPFGPEVVGDDALTFEDGVVARAFASVELLFPRDDTLFSGGHERQCTVLSGE